MAHIVTMAEFAYAIGKTELEAQEHDQLLDLAEGLVEEELGTQDPWPTIAKTTVLAAAARAFFNPEGLRQETIGGVSQTHASAAVGVYLTDDEVERLGKWKTDNLNVSQPTFEFPGTWPYPDRVERQPDAVTG